MAQICPGALVKILWNMNSKEKAAVDQRPFLLQIISIVPALGENDLEPRMGFYVKVSDSSHATYVSLPSTFEEMILNDKLQLGQYIYACELEPASPVPILKGVRPLPGRHPCVGTPEDIVSINSLQIGRKCRGFKVSPVDEAAQRTVKIFERSRSVHSSSDSETTVNKKKNKSSGISQSIPSSPVHEFFPSTSDSSSPTYEDLTYPASIVMEQCELSNSCGIEKQRVASLPARQKSIRRNWEGPFDARTRGWLPRPIRQPKSRRSSVSPSHLHGSSDNRPRKDEALNSITVKRRDGERTSKLANSLIKKIPAADKTCKAGTDVSVPSKSSNRITKVHWVSVPPSLAKNGKEVSKHRDAALLAAVEALQEASATERLIRCLSTFAELQTLSKQSDPQSTVEHFLNLHDELTQAMHIIQSLAKASTPRMIDNKPISSDEIDEAFMISLDRKKCTASWIKAAVASDLSPLQETSTYKEIVTQREMNSPSCSNKTKGSSLFTYCIKYGAMNTEEAMEKEDPKWVKGLALKEAAELASSLHSECRTWFLNYIDQCLDQITNKKLPSVSDLQIAGILSQLKRVNDWLDKSESEDATFPSDDDTSSCEQVRKKIYSVLLEHVECTVFALENMSLVASQR